MNLFSPISSFLKRKSKSDVKKSNSDAGSLKSAQRRKNINSSLIPTRPLSRKSLIEENYLSWGFSDPSWRIKFYRFLRDNIPILSSAIWTWSKLCAAPSTVQIKGTDEEKLLESGKRIILDLDRRIYQHSFQKFGGVDALLSQFFTSLFTDGMVCGELVLSASGDRVDKFYFIDPVTIRFELKDNRVWELYQEVEGRKIKLHPSSTFYYGLDSDSDNPGGHSLLTSIGFVAKIEQTLLNDMQKTMHNAGYHRLHLSIKPPERLGLESDEAYISRANRYFEDTVEMMKKFAPEDNPVTWSDVEIKYVGPSGQLSSTTSWYLNHKALIEDICAGVHLDPFMLGYSYGTTQNWAKFKYEMILRNVVSIQRAAKRFLEWVRNIELALWGLDLETEHHFDNRKSFDILEQRQAERIHLENIIKKKNEKLISLEEAKREIQSM